MRHSHADGVRALGRVSRRTGGLARAAPRVGDEETNAVGARLVCTVRFEEFPSRQRVLIPLSIILMACSRHAVHHQTIGGNVLGPAAPHHSRRARSSAARTWRSFSRFSSSSHPARISVSPSAASGSSSSNRPSPARLRARCFRQRSVEDDGIGAKHSGSATCCTLFIAAWLMLPGVVRKGARFACPRRLRLAFRRIGRRQF
jgi:hypothetical protein